jgi:PAS domain S-box-containing protein
MNTDRVLVVDDDEGLLHLITIALRRSGYEVESAGDGLKAAEILRSQGPFAVLLTDLVMPGMSGQELVQVTRQIDPSIEVIVITSASTLESALSTLRKNGAYDYLLKPLESMNQLAVVVERALRHRQLVKEREALQAQVQMDEERLKVLLTYTGDAVISAGSDGRLAYVNPAAMRLLGREDLVGSEVHSNLPAVLSELITQWQDTGNHSPEITEIPWVDKSVQMVSLAPVAVGNGDFRGWVMILSDVTYRKSGSNVT